MAAGRIMALDYGTKRIGVALSDELGWLAQPVETFERRTLESDLRHIERLVHERDVREVVLGLPLRLDGTEGPAAQVVREFAERLREALPVPVMVWDERYTTHSAEQLLIEGDVSRKKRKGLVDRVAAAILLQHYLESRDARTNEHRTKDASETPNNGVGCGPSDEGDTFGSRDSDSRSVSDPSGRISYSRLDSRSGC